MLFKVLIGIVILFVGNSNVYLEQNLALQQQRQRQQELQQIHQRNKGRNQQQQQQQHITKWKMTQHNKHANISELLDNLLRGYDNSIRPGFGGPPATVEVDIMVRSMGPISEVDMTYSMDCYFRQSWVDKRLAFKGAQDTLALSITMLARIWKPDTYFLNGRQSYLHTITTPNKFVRIYQDGRVLYSSRLTIKAGCPMNLEDFPMDIQRCPLKFGSFGYTSTDVVYRWNVARSAVAIAEDMKLSQFDLVDCPAGNASDITSPYSLLTVDFYLKRHMGNFLIQVYGPCCLLVVLSWVSFWLNREATADRISLGITTVLTMTFLGLEARTDLPKVPYPTALDFFVFLSFGFIFATIIQFAIVHYFTKYGSGECYFIIDDYDSESESEDADNTLKTLSHMPSEIDGSTESTLFEVIPLAMCSIPIQKQQKQHRKGNETTEPLCDWNCFRRKKTSCESMNNSMCEEALKTPPPRRLSYRQTSEESQYKRRRKKQPHYNSVSKIDIASRVVFPILFLIINIFYWCAYLARSSRLSHESPT